MGFYVVGDRIVPAQNKYMLTLFNESATGRKVVIERICRCNWQVAAVVGVLLEQYIVGVTARTPGTPVPIGREDASAPPLTPGIVAHTNCTAVSEAPTFVTRFFASSEEVTLANIAETNVDYETVWWRRPGSSGLVARVGQGITIKNLTNSTIGSVSYRIEFRDDPA